MPELTPVAEIPSVALPAKISKAKGKQLMEESLKVLQRLQEYESPEDNTEIYLESQSGRYVRMLEDIVDVAAEHGLLELTASTIFGLLKMTKAGKVKADLSIAGISKLREESSLNHLSDEQLADLLGKKE